MSRKKNVLDYANELEWLLCDYLDCGRVDFGVKANGCLDSTDWKSPVNFALGHKYAKSNNNPIVKQEIDYFLGNEFQGECIGEIIQRYNYYGFNSPNDAYDYIETTIDRIREILSL